MKCYAIYFSSSVVIMPQGFEEKIEERKVVFWDSQTSQETMFKM